MTFIKEDWIAGCQWMYRNTEFPTLRRELIEHNDKETRQWTLDLIDHMEAIAVLLVEKS